MNANLKFDIPKECYIRWQAALAVLEDLQEDIEMPFSMGLWASHDTKWDKPCGTSACFAGYISVSPYCRELGLPENDGALVQNWLLADATYGFDPQSNRLYSKIFHHSINKGSRAKTLRYLQSHIKAIFKASTGKILKAPITFYID